MRAREFVAEGRHSPPETWDQAPMPADYGYPLHNTFVLPGIRNNDAYKSYRFGVALARARAHLGGEDKDLPPWHAAGALGPNAVVAGFNNNVDPVIDLALKMSEIPGGKKPVGTPGSDEPPGGEKHSPVKAFKGYPR
jgi:hypothetical protein